MSDTPTGTVTFLFTDVEGSTQHWERDRAGMSAALAGHDELLRSAIADHAGHVFKTVGDAFCAAFARASDGLDAALATQLLLAAEVPDLRVRAALHTGQAEKRDGDYFGPALNRVARLLAVGHGGQVLLSEVTAGLLRDGLGEGLNLRDLGEHRLRDLNRPERVFQLLAPGLAADFPPLVSLDARPHNLPLTATSFVGRQRELATRDRHLAWCLALAEDAEPHLTKAEAAKWLDALERRHPDLRVALDWGLARGGKNRRAWRGVRLWVALWRFHQRHTHYRELAARAPSVISWSRQIGDDRLTADCLYAGAWPKIALVPQELDAAILQLSEALALYTDLGLLQQAAWAHNDIAATYTLIGEWDTAEQHFRVALDLKRLSSTPSDIAGGISGLAEVQRARSAFHDARASLNEALSLEIEDPYARYMCLQNLGLVELRLGEAEAGTEHLLESLRLGITTGDRRTVTMCVGGLGCAAAMARDGKRAARLQGATAALCTKFGVVVEPIDQRDFDHFTSLAHTLLTPAEWDAAYAEGVAMSEDEAVAYALSGADEP